MDKYQCPRCRSTDFRRLESIDVDSTGKAMQTEEEALKCDNCQQRVIVADDGTITAVDSVPPTNLANRVRSSVTAETRGVGRIGRRDLR
jgi:hypothetical protein